MNSSVCLSIIIVSYDTRELLKKCISSVKEGLSMSGIKGEIIVVDNASKDNSAGIAKESGAILVQNKVNLGFGRANNQGAEIARGKYLLFLNSDTVTEKGMFEGMINFLDQDPEVGVASCQLKNMDGTIQFQGGNLPDLATMAIWALFLDDLPILHQILPSYQLRKNIKKPQEVGWVGGAAMFIKRECWDQLKGFDGEIFMYGEDVELCYRAKKKGWKIMINPETSVVHLGKGSGEGKTGWVTGEIRGLLYLFSKHKPGRELPLLKLILRLGMGARWLVFGILGGNEQLRKAYLEAYLLV